MTLEQINNIMAGGPVDFDRPSAPMKLAWARLAQIHWTARRFDVSAHELRRELGVELRQAWADVRKVREGRSCRAKTEKVSAVALDRLKQQRRDLENKPLAMNIRPAQQEIDTQIAAIYAAT